MDIDSQRTQPHFVVFPEMTDDEERIAAVLITKHESGELRAHVRDLDGRSDPDPEAVAMLKQSIELRRL